MTQPSSPLSVARREDILSLADGVLPHGVPSGLAGRTKRGADMLLAGIALLFMAPLFLGLAVLIKLQDGGPVFYRQLRRGRGGEHFTLYKFRTMRPDGNQMLAALLAKDKDARAQWTAYRKLRNDPRITPIGKFLRRSSLDELPQFLNIVLGDMSIVGPRPIIDEEFDRFGVMAPVYEAARPGLTGLWQISGRNETDFTTRVALDVAYVQNWSFWQDIKILFKTVPVVLLARGAY
ncbi:MAG: sugar transferase [Pseudomonadota bacterium]